MTATRSDRDWRRARRAAARRHHPDVGGSVDELLAAIALVDRAFAAAPTRGLRTRSGRLRRLARRLRLRRRFIDITSTSSERETPCPARPSA